MSFLQMSFHLTRRLKDILFADGIVSTIPHLAHLDAIRFHRVGDSRKMQYSSKMKLLALSLQTCTFSVITFRS